jgi:hypothetical protein
LAFGFILKPFTSLCWICSGKSQANKAIGELLIDDAVNFVAAGADYGKEGVDHFGVKLSAAHLSDFDHGLFVANRLSVGAICGHGVVGV